MSSNDTNDSHSSNTVISRPISSRSTPNVYVSSQSLSVQIPADGQSTTQSSTPSTPLPHDQTQRQQDLDNRMMAARLGLQPRYTSMIAPGSNKSARYWVKTKYAEVNVSPFNEPLTSNLNWHTLKAMVEQRYSHHSSFFQHIAENFYSEPRQSTYLLYGELKTSLDPTTYKLTHYTHGNHCIIRFGTGLWYEGSIRNNKYNGIGTMTYPNGSYYKGEWLNAKKHGQGMFVELSKSSVVKVYEGTFVDDVLAEGTLTQTLKQADGKKATDVYVGEFKGLYPNGKGKLTFSSGATYEGDWNMGKRHGQGIYKNITMTPSSCTCGAKCIHAEPIKVSVWYEGQWVNDKQTGTGTIKVFNYDTQELSFMYEGSMNDNIKFGLGSSVDITGLVIQGEYSNNLANGKCKMLHTKRGWFYEGDVQNGKRHGTGTMYAADGSVLEGTFTHNIMNGHARIVSPGGGMYEGMIVNDKAEGLGKHTYPNGWVFEGEFVAGVRTKGLLKYSDTEWYCGEFKNGMFHGQGTLSNKEGVFTGTFEAGEAHGTGSFTFADGTIVSGEFSHGFNPDVSATVNQFGKLRRQSEPVLHRLHSQQQNATLAKPISITKKRSVANLSAKTRRLMKKFKVPDNVQLVEQLVYKLPKGVKMSDITKVYRAALKLVNKCE